MATRKPIKSISPRKPTAGSPKPSGALTSERISDDLAAFERAGGRISVLGTTRVLCKVAEMEEKKNKGDAGE